MTLSSAQASMAYLRVIFSGTVVPIGMTTNIIAIYIFRQKALNSKDTKHGEMNALLCFFNSLSLSSSFLISQFLPYFNVLLVNISDASCCIFNVWLRFTLQVPSLHQCLVTFLFYLSIRYPTKSKFMYEKGFIIKCMLGMFAFILLVNIEYYWYYLVYTYTITPRFDSALNRTVNVTVETSRVCGADFLPGVVGDYINILMRCFIPFLLLLIFNILIMHQVAKTKRTISTPVTSRILSNSKGHNEARFGRILIALNMLFLLLLLPWAMSFIVSYALTNMGVRISNLITGSNDEELVYLYNITYCLSFCYNASPFFVNLAFNKLFRREFLRLFCPFIPTIRQISQYPISVIKNLPDVNTVNTTH